MSECDVNSRRDPRIGGEGDYFRGSVTHLGEKCIHESIAALDVDRDVVWADIVVVALGLQQHRWLSSRLN